MQSEAQRTKLKRRLTDERALQLRLNGTTYVSIANALGYSNAGTAAKAVSRALKRHPDTENLEVTRRMQNQRLDQALLAISGQIRGGSLMAVDRLIAIETLRAKLDGTFAPTETKQSGKIEITEHHDYAQLTDEQRAEEARSILELVAARNRITIGPSNTAGATEAPYVDAVVVEIS